MTRWCFVLMLLILLLNDVLPFSSASQNFSFESQNVTEATTEGDGSILGNIRDFMDNTYMYISSIPILRILKTVGVALGVALATFFIAPIALFLLLCCIGFTCSGVLAASCAAICQSNIGNVEAGSCFSCAQSMGACGMMGIYVLIGVIFGIPAGAIAGYYAWFYFV
ncbi:interferon-alpha-induced [Daphnia pulex]|uniref:Interferon-alpha-induced n=1 Tax=Daphnia pulex TaxID=6669 RepID=E9HCQ8_DAPPU|nr:interferon-alpha-induced [Daphnia pulex]|eukprot:EFX70474.1 interferon-alpha-induced [Daphnia pulex]